MRFGSWEDLDVCPELPVFGHKELTFGKAIMQQPKLADQPFLPRDQGGRLSKIQEQVNSARVDVGYLEMATMFAVESIE